MPGNVLLLRSPSEDTNGPDKYEAAFRARGYGALSIPVLETVFTNADELAQIVRAGGQLRSSHYSRGEHEATKDREGGNERYAGVIVTSGRACEAWQAAVQHVTKTGGGGESRICIMKQNQACLISHIAKDQSNEGWSTLPFYAVGQATASALSAIRTSFPTSPHAPHDIRGGAESGTAEKLAHFIVSDLSSSTHRRLLYLTGDKNRDTLPSILAQAGFELDSLQVYATQGSSRFGEDLKNALDGVQAIGEHRCWRYARAMQLAERIFPRRPLVDRALRAQLRKTRLPASLRPVRHANEGGLGEGSRSPPRADCRHWTHDVLVLARRVGVESGCCPSETDPRGSGGGNCAVGRRSRSVMLLMVIDVNIL